MKASLFSFAFLLFSLLPLTLYGTPERNEVKRQSVAFLDSLKIIIDKNQFAKGEITFQSISPASKEYPLSFAAYEISGQFTESIPLNGKQRGLVTPPLDIFKGGRISLVYHFVDKDRNEYTLVPDFTFTSRMDEVNLIQTLTVRLAGNHPVSLLRYSMYDVEIWEDNGSIRQADNNPPVLRRVLSFNQELEGDYKVTYYYKDRRGVIKGTHFEDGADISEPEFKGEEMEQYFYFQKNLRYPEEAWQNQIGGTVLVRVTIDEKGDVKEAGIFGSGIPALNEEALRLVKSTSDMWIPAQRNGINEEGELIIPTQFQPGSVPPATNGEVSQQDTVSQEFRRMVAALEAARNQPTSEKKNGSSNNPYLIILFAFIAIYLTYYYYRRKFILKCQQPNDHPQSVFNKELMEHNKKLDNDGLIIITGVTMKDIEEVIHPDIIHSIEEIKPGIIAVKMKERLQMDEFYYLIFILNEPLTDTWAGIAVGWITIPLMDLNLPKSYPAMVYTEPAKKKGNYLYITTQDNNCFFFNPETYRYEPVALKQLYREHPIN